MVKQDLTFVNPCRLGLIPWLSFPCRVMSLKKIKEHGGKHAFSFSLLGMHNANCKCNIPLEMNATAQRPSFLKPQRHRLCRLRAT